MTVRPSRRQNGWQRVGGQEPGSCDASGPVGAPAFVRSSLGHHRRTNDLPRLTFHGLRHAASTRMVPGPTDLGELRAIADLLGLSNEMLTNTHALPNSQPAGVERLRRGPESCGPGPVPRATSSAMQRGVERFDPGLSLGSKDPDQDGVVSPASGSRVFTLGEGRGPSKLSGRRRAIGPRNRLAFDWLGRTPRCGIRSRRSAP